MNTPRRINGIARIVRPIAYIPSGPRMMAAMPVRATSTRPSGSISAMNCSILSLAPVISNTKLSVVGVDHARAEGIGEPQGLDAVARPCP